MVNNIMLLNSLYSVSHWTELYAKLVNSKYCTFKINVLYNVGGHFIKNFLSTKIFILKILTLEKCHPTVLYNAV